MLLVLGEGSEPYVYQQFAMRPLSSSPSPPTFATQTSNRPTGSTNKKVIKPEDTLPTPRPSIDDHNRNQLRREELLGKVCDLSHKVISDPLNKAGARIP